MGDSANTMTNTNADRSNSTEPIKFVDNETTEPITVQRSEANLNAYPSMGLNPAATEIISAVPLQLYSIHHGVYPHMDPNPTSNLNDIPVVLHPYALVFSEEKANILPEHRIFDCAIELLPGVEPPHGRMYNLTVSETTHLKEWVDDMEQKKFISPSASPYAAPIFFVKKKDGSLRPCVDYRRLNAITLRDRYPIPLISDLIRSLSTAKIFSLMDLRGAYNLLRIKKGDEPKTAFVCKFGQYEFNVMPFGLVNAPSCFQAMMDKLFKDYSNFARPYLDDIIVFSHNEEEHSLHLQQVCQVLKDNKLYAKLNKCHFFKTSLSYLGYIISTTGIHMDSDKVKTISDWPTPRNVKDVQCFLGFANFYRRFIPTYSTFTQPITKLLKKDVPFVWDTNCSTAFTKVKEAFQAETFLAHPNEQLAYIVESDASDFAVGGVLSQMDDKGKMVPIAFHSRGMMPAERNYEIYDKELLAIVVLFQQWRHFLQGGRHKVTVITDHLNLKYFLSTKQLTRRQARWSLFLNEFDFVITHKPGLLHGRADGPSRRPDYNTKTEPQNFKQLLAPHQLQLNAIVSSLPLNIHFDYAK
jgi:hypothetical protein